MKSEAAEIIERLQQRGHSLADIASATDISFASIWRYAHGKRPHKPYLKLLRQMEAQGNDNGKTKQSTK